MTSLAHLPSIAGTVQHNPPHGYNRMNFYVKSRFRKGAVVAMLQLARLLRACC